MSTIGSGQAVAGRLAVDWTKLDDALRARWAANESWDVMSAALGVSKGKIRCRVARLSLPLRQKPDIVTT